jgi:hypothetical protein
MKEHHIEHTIITQDAQRYTKNKGRDKHPFLRVLWYMFWDNMILALKAIVLMYLFVFTPTQILMTRQITVVDAIVLTVDVILIIGGAFWFLLAIMGAPRFSMWELNNEENDDTEQ